MKLGIMNWLAQRFGSGSGRLRRLLPPVLAAERLAEGMRKKPEEWFPRRMEELRRQIQSLPEEQRNAVLDGILPEVFAMAAEAGRRKLGLEIRRGQLLCACALHRGMAAEMDTGEGKTLAAVPAAVLNALAWPVHIATANSYLASRDAEWTGPAHAMLGLTCGSLDPSMDDDARREVYQRDVVYAADQEFGFDYLRDNMKTSLDAMVQRGLGFALVDEADSALIDEARTPLVISGPGKSTEDLWRKTAEAVASLDPDCWTCDEKHRTACLTDRGVERIEEAFGVESLYDPDNALLQHHVMQSLRAAVIFRRDRDYVVRDGEILVVDELTGRALPGRRWSEGLHQAVEAKEGLKVRAENRTEAAISFQSFFGLYRKLAGMSGTVVEAGAELKSSYGLETVRIPPFRPCIRKDLPDRIYLTAAEKFSAAAEEVRRLHDAGRPVLVGTSSVEVSEALSRRLSRMGLAHEVLNAKEHAREAEIAALAGRSGRITVATNMAGRGVDIMLDEPARKAGGLAVIGTERTESRRADDQLRGRAGRQGDPGSSQFFVSLEDPLPRIFGADRLKGLLAVGGAGHGEPVRAKGAAKALERAQRRVEELHFETRKQLMDYDSALNSQREVVYALRRAFIDPETACAATLEEAQSFVDGLFAGGAVPDAEELREELAEVFALPAESLDGIRADASAAAGFCTAAVAARQKAAGAMAGEIFGRIFLAELDDGWRIQLRDMEALKDGIGLRSYSREDPKTEYRKAAWELFQRFLDRARRSALRVACRTEFGPETQ